MSFRLLFHSLHFLAMVFATISLVCFDVQEKEVGKNSCFGVSLFRGLVMPDRMERMGIITKVEQPTKGLSPIVEVKKPKGDVCICLDPVKREHYSLRAVEEVAASLAEARVFSTLDATSGFY